MAQVDIASIEDLLTVPKNSKGGQSSKERHSYKVLMPLYRDNSSLNLYELIVMLGGYHLSHVLL